MFTRSKIKIQAKFIILLVVLTLFMALTACGSESATTQPDNKNDGAKTGSTVRLVPGKDPTTLEVWVDNVERFYALDMEINFNPTLLQVADADSVKDGIQIAPGQVPVPDFVAENEANNSTGIIRYVITQMAPREGFTGNGLIATINWQSEFNPQANVSINTITLVNQDGQPIEATVIQ